MRGAEGMAHGVRLKAHGAKQLSPGCSSLVTGYLSLVSECGLQGASCGVRNAQQFKPGVVKISYFHKGFLSPFLFRYKLGAILNFGTKEFCLL